MMKKIIKFSIFLIFVFIFLAANTHQETNFPKITFPYYPEIAAQNGDVVVSFSGYRNIDKWNQFLANINAQKKDKVRVTSYTVEGSPIFHELIYNGNIIQYIFDNSLDGFGLYAGRPKFICEQIDVIESDGHQYYTLANCDKDIGVRFVFPVGL